MATEAKSARIELEEKLSKILYEKIKENQELIIKNKINQTKIDNLAQKAQEQLERSSMYQDKINKYQESLNDTSNTIPKNSETVELYMEHYREVVQNSNKYIKEIVDLFPKVGNESSFLNIDFFNHFLERFKEFLTTLNTEQKASVINFIGLIVIL